MHVTTEACNHFCNVWARKDAEEQQSSNKGAVLGMVICGCILWTGQCWGSRTWEICGLAVQHVEPGEEVAHIGALM